MRCQSSPTDATSVPRSSLANTRTTREHGPQVSALLSLIPLHSAPFLPPSFSPRLLPCTRNSSDPRWLTEPGKVKGNIKWWEMINQESFWQGHSRRWNRKQNSLVSPLMTHREAGIGPAAQRPEAQERGGESGFNLCCAPLSLLGPETHVGLKHSGEREFTHFHTWAWKTTWSLIFISKPHSQHVTCNGF